MVLVALLGKILNMRLFRPIFPSKFMKRLMKERSLKFITESPELDTVETQTKAFKFPKLEEGYRSTCYLKLKEIEKQHKLAEPGHKVLDIGAAPGSWSQYLAERTNSNKSAGDGIPVGTVIAIDLENFNHIEGVHCLPGMDFLKESSQNKIMETLGRRQKFDFIFSDMSAPKVGVPWLDEEKMVKMVFCVYLFLVKHLKQGGGCLIKIQGAEKDLSIRREAKKLFRLVTYPVPVGFPDSAPEMYLLGKEFF